VYSRHAWGGQFEWHSNTSAGGYTGDGYVGLAGISTHTHYGTGYNHSPRNDPMDTTDVIGHVGGGRTSFYMIDNPNFGTH